MHLQVATPPDTIDAAFPWASLVPQGRFASLAPVSVGRPLTVIGSGHKVHVRLRSRTVSPLHALLLNADSQAVIRDLASKSHVYVNRRLTRQSALNDGDEVRVGRIRFVFRSGDAVPGANGTCLPPETRLWNAHGQASIIAGPVFLLGARRDADLVIEREQVAPAHAAILRIGHLFLLRDLGCLGGTRLNGQPVAMAVLQAADVIEIGGQEFQFDQAQAAITSTPHLAQPVDASAAADEATASAVDPTPAPQVPLPDAQTSLPQPPDCLDSQEIQHPDPQPSPNIPIDDDPVSVAKPLAAMADTVDQVTEPIAADQPAVGPDSQTGNQNLVQQILVPDIIKNSAIPMPAGDLGSLEVHEKTDSRAEAAQDASVPDLPESTSAELATAQVAAADSKSPDPPSLTSPPSPTPAIRDWGPLALALASQLQPELLPRTTTVEVPPPPRRRRNLWIIAAAVVLLALAVAAVWVVATGSH